MKKRVINDTTTALHFSKTEEKCGKRMVVERWIYKKEEGIVWFYIEFIKLYFFFALYLG